jgi:hypothetical protein
LKFFYTNPTSLNNKLNDLEALINTFHWDILGFSETWFNERSVPNMPDYQLFRKDRACSNVKSKGGGVCIYARSDINCSETSNSILSKATEQIWCEIVSGVDILLVGCIYKPPETDVSPIVTSLYEARRLLESSHITGIVVMGDFNFRNITWDQNGVPFASFRSITKSEQASTDRFIECYYDCFLYQHVFEATFQKGDGNAKSVLDLVLSESPERIFEFEIGPALGKTTQTHLSISFKVSVSSNQQTKSRLPRFAFQKGNYDELNKFFKKIDWQEWLRLDQGVEIAYSQFLSAYSIGCEKFISLQSSKSGKKRPGWFNNEVKKAINDKRRLWYKLRASGFHPTVRIEYEAAKKRACREVKTAIYKFECDLSSMSKSNPKLIYAYFNSKRKVRGEIRSLIDQNGVSVTNRSEIAAILNAEFQSSFRVEDLGSLPDFPSRTEVLCEDNTDTLFTHTVIKDKLDKLNKFKSCGVDKVHPYVLASCAESLAEPLLMLFKCSYNTGKLPEVWKLANVTPIHKKGCRSKASNYRPISLTSVVCRVMESIIKDVIMDHLVKNDLISKAQHGFLKGKSCTTNLLEAQDIITKAIEQGYPVDIILLDFFSAFNLVPHARLCRIKLVAHGIIGKLLNWITEFLHDRKQRVVLGEFISAWLSVFSGVPQGSVLGPILFIIFINDLADLLSNNPKKFADDTKLIGVIANPRDVLSVQDDLDRVAEWCRVWGMALNESKCKVMHVGRKNIWAEYFVNGHKLEVVETEKDLGVVISSDLKWSSHVSMAVSTANRVLGQVKNTFRYLDRYTVTTLFKTMVRPHLEYAAAVWNPYYLKDIRAIEQVQHRATKMVKDIKQLGYPQRLAVLGLPTLEERK